MTKVASASNSPRRLGSCARLPIKRLRRDQLLRDTHPARRATGTEARCGRRTGRHPAAGRMWNSWCSARILSASAPRRPGRRSGVRASMTATSRLLFCGNASSSARSFCRQATSLGSMRSISVSTDRWSPRRRRRPSASTRHAISTGTALRRANSTMRATMAAITRVPQSSTLVTTNDSAGVISTNLLAKNAGDAVTKWTRLRARLRTIGR